MRLAILGLAAALSTLGGAAMADDAIPADIPQCAGAYGASASPSAFLGQGPALEMLV